MQLYETIVVLDPDLSEEDIGTQLTAIEDCIKSHGGSLQYKDPWGKRQLAYQIEGKDYGHYFTLVHDGDSSLVPDLERRSRINDQILRSLTVKKDKFAPDRSPKARERDEAASKKAEERRN